ncbi:stress response transcriptional regulator NmlR [Streptococcus mutans]|jgi:DNA-binding transcriptional MerR regulator|uniref:Transcriptional regulator (MerR family) n=1 Tax=Streptococcus mutans serotype c (strain ATCC 700610 / UA159) TaxID=210007 RepID=Q8DV39_STRMU|nr:stress response transcriptional regulator NmlR [Streptococcus mutans]AAN58411.1 putative transcriptional regulator (MerR family) [Streptococcus mutans UA159]AJD55064.1 MerR family transcriptional regulator [Streptococcus mutans UA159-FR]EMB60374.1 MerR family transcriptional regulator [Streptococcus mutans 8ID3]EMB80975.1 MerR family transcriptional regulator [Streptococcus mutans NFSM2]EMB84002.1 MerR family transcriptional regulator [Streptococcus mutans NVAB]
MNIKKVSEITDISADTIRYYERIGLLPRITRTNSGVRDFTEREIGILEFVRCFRKAGMSVEALIEYISLLEEGEGTERERLRLLTEQRDEMDDRIYELNQARERLNYKIENYENIIQKHEQKLFTESEEN